MQLPLFSDQINDQILKSSLSKAFSWAFSSLRSSFLSYYASFRNLIPESLLLFANLLTLFSLYVYMRSRRKSPHFSGLASGIFILPSIVERLAVVCVDFPRLDTLVKQALPGNLEIWTRVRHSYMSGLTEAPAETLRWYTNQCRFTLLSRLLLSERPGIQWIRVHWELRVSASLLLGR